MQKLLYWEMKNFAFRKVNGNWYVWNPNPVMFLNFIEFDWIEGRRVYQTKINS